ncbi:siderophore-interacting protein [Cellulomonas iranensis]|uniref:siderophore-interacting protein n=1 Tax=Cellulomonas iranensis TaxID=76862 RepID=UPI001CF50982|nr:siderophore-interacting protein [Cellulomonas iranensis]UCN15085.1 siderophore-interacting protein [Cellulomonas iranensis]
MALDGGLTPRIWRAEVTHVRRLTPGMVRVTLGGPGMTEYGTTGVGDEYVRVFFPHAGQDEPVMPRVAGRSWEFDDPDTAAPMRTYTVRAWRPGEVDVDFVVHDGGVAAAWALRARPGDVVGLTTPIGLYDPPDGTTWQLLLADATGLPAALRLLEQAPPGVRTRAVLEVPDATHHQDVAPGAHADVTWVHGGNGHGPSALADLLPDVTLPDGPGYVWVAGETRVLRAVRRHLRHERALPGADYKIVGYWTAQAELWRERYDALPAPVRSRLASLWDDAGRDPEEIEDEYDDQLERLGL